jgi:hypothetical protein
MCTEKQKQGLTLEGRCCTEITKDKLKMFLIDLTLNCGLDIYDDPIVFMIPPGRAGETRPAFSGLVPCVNASLSAYIWGDSRSFIVQIYAQDAFDRELARDLARDFFSFSDEKSKSAV